MSSAGLGDTRWYPDSGGIRVPVIPGFRGARSSGGPAVAGGPRLALQISSSSSSSRLPRRAPRALLPTNPLPHLQTGQLTALLYTVFCVFWGCFRQLRPLHRPPRTRTGRPWTIDRKKGGQPERPQTARARPNDPSMACVFQKRHYLAQGRTGSVPLDAFAFRASKS